MKQNLVNFLKYNKIIYTIFYHLFSFFINLIKIFIVPDDKLILFNSYGGRKYDDSPKLIFQAMVEDKRFSDYKFVWAFHDPQKYDIKNAIIIKTDTLNYFIKALKEMGANSRFYIEKVFDKKKVVEITLNTLFSN